jgi:hypothetical protein
MFDLFLGSFVVQVLPKLLLVDRSTVIEHYVKLLFSSGKIVVIELGLKYCYYFDFYKVVHQASPCMLTLHIFYILTCLILVI